MKCIYFLTATLSLALAVPISNIDAGTNESQGLERRGGGKPNPVTGRPDTPHPNPPSKQRPDSEEIEGNQRNPAQAGSGDLFDGAGF